MQTAPGYCLQPASKGIEQFWKHRYADAQACKGQHAGSSRPTHQSPGQTQAHRTKWRMLQTAPGYCLQPASDRGTSDEATISNRSQKRQRYSFVDKLATHPPTIEDKAATQSESHSQGWPGTIEYWAATIESVDTRDTTIDIIQILWGIERTEGSSHDKKSTLD